MKQYSVSLALAVVAITFLAAGTAVAVTQSSATSRVVVGIYGMVNSINGETFTIKFSGGGFRPTPNSQTSSNNGLGLTYTVTASNATVTDKDGAASSLSAVKVGEYLVVDGTVSGTSMTANTIAAGVPPKSGDWETVGPVIVTSTLLPSHGTIVGAAQATGNGVSATTSSGVSSTGSSPSQGTNSGTGGGIFADVIAFFGRIFHFLPH